MRILLVCAAGMSTSLLVTSMKKVAGEDVVIEAHPIAELESIADNFDIVLVGPQVRYKYAKVEDICRERHVATGLIDMAAYGRMDGKAVMQQVKKIMEARA